MGVGEWVSEGVRGTRRHSRFCMLDEGGMRREKGGGIICQDCTD